MTEMAALYEAVKNMPDGPQKSLFLKKVPTLNVSLIIHE